jgi:hypothetical protein
MNILHDEIQISNNPAPGKGDHLRYARFINFVIDDVEEVIRSFVEVRYYLPNGTEDANALPQTFHQVARHKGGLVRVDPASGAHVFQWQTASGEDDWTWNARTQRFEPASGYATDADDERIQTDAWATSISEYEHYINVLQQQGMSQDALDQILLQFDARQRYD